MIVVIQCAGTKRAGAGTLRAADGRPVRFVARPELAPEDGALWAHPDDGAGDGVSWREKLARYNAGPGGNPLGLLPALELYSPAVYGALAGKLGARRLFILSAGWGLISGGFLVPDYDITFSAQAEPYKRRRKRDHYDDFCMLARESTEPVVFFGGRDYLPLFCSLTSGVAAPRIVFYRSDVPPQCPGCSFVRYETARRTNWHYECAEAFLAQRLDIPVPLD